MKNLNRPVTSDNPNTKKDDFLEALTRLAHMLSQPLTSLRGSAEVALMGQLNESEARHVLELLLEEFNRMAEVLEALREILEMEASDSEIQPVSWTRNIKKALEAEASADDDRRQRLIVSLPSEVYVKANPCWLDMATQRLVGRALKAAHRLHSVRVELSVVDETACLSVRGEGRSADLTTAATGAGASYSPSVLELGEASWLVVRRAVEGQGGRLEVSWPSENVCCCRIYLPLASLEPTGNERNNMHRESCP